jgi:hypothetical protein
MRKLLLLTALALGAGVVHADDNLFYIGAGISRNSVSDITNSGASFSDIDNTSWKVLAGFRPISPFAVEVDYMDLGSQTNTFFTGAESHSDAKAFAGYAVGFLPIPVPFLDVYGKAGLARWRLDGTSGFPAQPGNFFAFSNQGTEFAWGVGTQAHIGNIGGRLEYEDFKIPNTNGAKVFSLSFILSLL